MASIRPEDKSSLPVALLDANVLVPIELCDVILSAAFDERLFRPVWSDAILDEVERTLVRLRPDLDPARLRRRVLRMRERFPEAVHP